MSCFPIPFKLKPVLTRGNNLSLQLIQVEPSVLLSVTTFFFFCRKLLRRYHVFAVLFFFFEIHSHMPSVFPKVVVFRNERTRGANFKSVARLRICLGIPDEKKIARLARKMYRLPIT